jgi:hypothetical protein
MAGERCWECEGLTQGERNGECSEVEFALIFSRDPNSGGSGRGVGIGDAGSRGRVFPAHGGIGSLGSTGEKGRFLGGETAGLFGDLFRDHAGWVFGDTPIKDR